MRRTGANVVNGRQGRSPGALERGTWRAIDLVMRTMVLLLAHLSLGLALAGCSGGVDDMVTASVPAAEAPSITPSGVAGLPPEAAYSETAVEEAMLGYDASSITMATETQTRGGMAVFKDGLQMMQLVPGPSGGIGEVHGVSARLRGPNGERIGMTFAETGALRETCRTGRGNWLNMPICQARGVPNVTLVFAVPSIAAGGFDPLSSEALAAASLQRIIWTATPGGDS